MFPDDPLHIPSFLEGRPAALAARMRTSRQPWVETSARRITMTDPREVLRRHNERLNGLADIVQKAISEGAVTGEALIAALPHLSPRDVHDGAQRLRDRKRWAELRRRTVNR